MSSLLFDKNTWLEIGLPTCYIKRVLIYLQNVPPKTIFQFQLLYFNSCTWTAGADFPDPFFYFSFSISLFRLLKHFFLFSWKKRDDAYIFKGRAQMPKTMMQISWSKLQCRLSPKMLHQWKKKNEHGRHPLASVNETAKSDGTKIFELKLMGGIFVQGPQIINENFWVDMCFKQ